MPSHDMARFYALLAILAILDPTALEAFATALGVVVSLKQLH